MTQTGAFHACAGWRSTVRRSFSQFKTVSLIFLILTGSSLQCMPGRGGSRRRGSRRSTPLVFKQHIPNVSETVLGASGQAEKKISAESDDFKKLIKNENKDIIFRDEENTGDDRYMSARCREKLNILAVSVRHRWPYLRLRVTEGWDSGKHHASDSLHYEGRAVDITTSDRDRTKYGMLARLAVDAGFDWVYYESRSHIHCSVKSESSEALRMGGCFPGNVYVISRENRQTKMSDLRVGDHVMTIAEDGTQTYTEVIAFMDKRDRVTSPFITITTENGATIRLTESHHIYTYRSGTDRHNDTLYSAERNFFDSSRTQVVFARDIVIGDMLYVTDSQRSNVIYNDHDFTHERSGVGYVHTDNIDMYRYDEESSNNDIVKVRRVVSIDRSRGRGIYAPLTVSGTLLVDGVLVSCYALVSHDDIPHKAMAPYRVLYQWSSLVLPSNIQSIIAGAEHQNGVHWYSKILHSLGTWVMPIDSLYPTKS
uniref:Hedgehog protein n=1 Tax=Gymnomenia pellucida TaxID=1918950 RepID=A0A1J0M5N0_9MOLL|nr:hedgehog [Gymnomenia pellucida]